MKPQCPECGLHNILHRESDDTLKCRNCGHRWPKPKKGE
ncbi:hypothetical protein LCGC14_1627030 [marine sediment metagenome]|uniref:Uncharacterized protein n=1 Tax=marine sediment metagenome TaxID=412755 RepID=A0A0F9L3G6_9ZZZZ